MRSVAVTTLAIAIVIGTPFAMLWQALGTDAFVSGLLYGLP